MQCLAAISSVGHSSLIWSQRLPSSFLLVGMAKPQLSILYSARNSINAVHTAVIRPFLWWQQQQRGCSGLYRYAHVPQGCMEMPPCSKNPIGREVEATARPSQMTHGYTASGAIYASPGLRSPRIDAECHRRGCQWPRAAGPGILTWSSLKEFVSHSRSNMLSRCL